MRHGESIWNQENRFTGWTDVGLTDKGVGEAIVAARVMLKEGYTVDVAFTSLLKRAIKTLWLVLEEMDLYSHGSSDKPSIATLRLCQQRPNTV